MLHNRKAIRLKEYDYSTQGAYFVTICTHHREYVFGGINHVGAGPRPAHQFEPVQQIDIKKMILNDYGRMVDYTGMI